MGASITVQPGDSVSAALQRLHQQAGAEVLQGKSAYARAVELGFDEVIIHPGDRFEIENGTVVLRRAEPVARAPAMQGALDAPKPRGALDPPAPSPASTGHQKTLRALAQAHQVDRQPETRHDWVRCGPQSLVAIAVITGPDSVDRLVRSIERPSGHYGAMYDAIMADYADGSLSSESLEKLGDLLHHLRRVGQSPTADAIGATFSPHVRSLGELAPGESALVWGRVFLVEHITAVSLEPGSTDRYIHYDPLRNRPLRRNLSRSELDRILSGATRFQHVRWNT